MTGTAATPETTRETTPESRPRIRVAAVVWGLVVAALGVGVAWFVIDPSRVTSTGLSLLGAQPAALGIVAVGLVIVVGSVIVIGSLLSVVHRAQDRARDRRADGTERT
ncbi:hypothetical protein [Pseudolysinimonas sp.]|uniref:hypothetical protein n=1 Tax=Pseudolysinimonas sp. TaxID=2680009 RepID=UPI003F819379